MELQHFWDLTQSATFEPLTQETIERAEKELNAQFPLK